MNISDPIRDEINALPRPSRATEGLFIVAVALSLSALAALAGWALGSIHKRSRLDAFQTVVVEALNEYDAARLREALAEAQELRASIVKTPEVRLMMANLYSHAAELLPRRRLYYEEAFAEVRATKRLLPAKGVSLPLQKEIARLEANCFLETERYLESKAAIDRWEALLPDTLPPSSERLLLMNARAYLYAIADTPRVRDPLAALELAKSVIKSPTPFADGSYPSSNAPILDTLAEAYFAAGHPADALRVQTRALALASRHTLDIYLTHYDKYAAAAE